MGITPNRCPLTVPLLALLCVCVLPVLAQDRALAPVIPAAENDAPHEICAREFATIGSPGYDRVRVDPAGAQNAGHEIGRFWQASNSGRGNNFDGGCPSQSAEQSGGGWWELSQEPLRGLRGLIGELGCLPSSCPEGPLTVLVEELAAGWDPQADAYFIAFQVDATPTGRRYWDLSRVDPSPSPSVLTMNRYPELVITGSNRVGPDIEIEFTFTDVSSNVHAVRDPGVDTPLPASAIVKSFDLYHRFGNSDPGRSVEGWTRVESFGYDDEGTTGSRIVNCPPPGSDDEYFAVGLTFHGGEGPDVRGAYVGRSIYLECGGPQLPSQALGVLEHRPNPCTETGGETLVSTDPCTGRTALVGSSELDLELHLCQMMFVDGVELVPGSLFDCHSVLVYAMEPADPDCLVQVRELSADPIDEGLRLVWDRLPCSEDYDVIRGSLTRLTEGDLGPVLCIENDTVLTETVDSTAQDPEPGDAYFYLVRSRGAVGSAHYGHTSAGTTRFPTTGDCPLD